METRIYRRADLSASVDLLEPPDTLDTVVRYVRETPSRLAVLSFFAAKMVQRDNLDYFATFNRILGAAMAAGLEEGPARTRVYRGFAAAAAKHEQPPPALIRDTLEAA